VTERPSFGCCGPTFRVNGGPAHWGQDRIWALEEDVIAALSVAQPAL